MIAQVRAAFTAGTCLIIPEDGRLVKRKKQKSRKKDEKGGLPQSAHCICSQLFQ
jgi:L-serine deaminase